MRRWGAVTATFFLATFAAAQAPAAAGAAEKPAVLQPCSESAKLENGAAPVQLNSVRRIFVESFGDDPISREMQSTIVSSLVGSKRFTVTEDRHRADAFLKGVALGKTSQEVHAYGEATAINSAAISDSSLHTDTINEARVAMRLVNSDGDVIWTTTQESKGGKYKGASADVADICVKQLLRDVAKTEGGTSTPISAATAR